MFTLARQIIRHKVGVIAVVAFAVVMFSGDNNEDQTNQSSSPWAKNAPVQAVEASKSDEDSITAKLGSVAVAAGEVAAEKLLGDKDLNPVALGGEAIDSFNNTNEAFAKANSGN